jgi:hypothetical protein
MSTFGRQGEEGVLYVIRYSSDYGNHRPPVLASGWIEHQGQQERKLSQAQYYFPRSGLSGTANTTWSKIDRRTLFVSENKAHTSPVAFTEHKAMATVSGREANSCGSILNQKGSA